MKQGFIGFGNLANAIYQGLKEDKSFEFAYFTRSKKDVDLHYYEQLESLVSYADVIWLAVKPQDLANILNQLKDTDLSEKTIVSPVAGKSIAYIKQYLGKDITIVRIMPNLAVAYKASVTAFQTNHPNSKKADEIFNLLGKLGKVVKLEEKDFDLFTSVFGSGPAFILAFIKAFKNKIQEFDLPSSQLEELLLELTRGTTLYFMQNQKNHSVEELIKNITSKGGTTEAGLEYFHTHNIDKLLEEVLDAARNRSKELSKNGE